jgi:hypothetical protein
MAAPIVLRIRQEGGHLGTEQDQALELSEDYAFILTLGAKK